MKMLVLGILFLFCPLAARTQQTVKASDLYNATSVDSVAQLILRYPADVFDIAFGRRYDEGVGIIVKNVLYMHMSMVPEGPLVEGEIARRIRVGKASFDIAWSDKLPPITKSEFARGVARLLMRCGDAGVQVLKEKLADNQFTISRFAFEVLSASWKSQYFELLRPYLMDSDGEMFSFAIRAYRRWLEGGVRLNYDHDVVAVLRGIEKDSRLSRTIIEDARRALKVLGRDMQPKRPGTSPPRYWQ